MTSVFPYLTFCKHTALAFSNPTSYTTTIKPDWVTALNDSVFTLSGKDMLSLTHCGPRSTVDGLCWINSFDGALRIPRDITCPVLMPSVDKTTISSTRLRHP